MVPSQLNSLGGYSSRVDIARVSWLQPMPAIRQRFSCSWLLWERQIKPSSKVSAKKGASRRMLSAMLGWYLDQPRLESRSEQSWEFIFIPVVPARGGAEVALKIYIRPFSSIESGSQCWRWSRRGLAFPASDASDASGMTGWQLKWCHSMSFPLFW